MSAADEWDQREKDIRRLRKAILEGPLVDFEPSANAVIALEQAIHMVLTGV